jgi:hypothetical protein
MVQGVSAREAESAWLYTIEESSGRVATCKHGLFWYFMPSLCRCYIMMRVSFVKLDECEQQQQERSLSFFELDSSGRMPQLPRLDGCLATWVQ